jgi:hypothetical protein
MEKKLKSSEALVADDFQKQRNPDMVAEKMVKVTNKEQHIIWEGYGLRLHVPPNSLPENCSELKLKMVVSSTKDYKLPAKTDGILVSAVYSFSHNLGEKKFRKPVTLQMQHCVSSHFSSLLHIVWCAVSTQHQFKTLPGGNFVNKDGYGEIELDHFCCFGIMMQLLGYGQPAPPLRYHSALYYTNIQHGRFHFHLYVTPQLDATLEEIEQYFLNRNVHFERGPVSLFEFTRENIMLNLPQYPITGWIMRHLNTNEMNVDDIRNSPIIPFQVNVRWSGREGEPLSTLEHQLDISGAQRHRLLICSPDSCREFIRNHI